MKASFQLKRSDFNTAGYALIQFMVSWTGQRTREFTGELTKPEWWDKDTQLMRNVKGSYAGHVNDRLHELQNHSSLYLIEPFNENIPRTTAR